MTVRRPPSSRRRLRRLWRGTSLKPIPCTTQDSRLCTMTLSDFEPVRPVPKRSMGSRMDRQTSIEVHSRYCANRNLWVAFAFVAFCLMEAILSWRSLGKEQSAQPVGIILLGHGVAIAVLAQLLVVFKCLRERIVLSLGIVRLAEGLFGGLAPGWVSPVAVTLRPANLALWVLAGIISLTMLVSAARARAEMTG